MVLEVAAANLQLDFLVEDREHQVIVVVQLIGWVIGAVDPVQCSIDDLGKNEIEHQGMILTVLSGS